MSIRRSLPSSSRITPALAVLLPCVITGCGQRNTTAPMTARAPIRQNTDAADSTAPIQSPAWADHYGGPGEPVTRTEQEVVLYQAIEARLGTRCHLDGKLIQAARRHGRDLLESDSAVVDGQMERLRFTLLRLGVYDYAVEPFTRELDDKGRDELLLSIGEVQPAWSHCGLGIVERSGEQIAVWIGVRRAVLLSPLPVIVNAFDRVEVSGTVLGPPDAAVRLFVGYPDHTVQALPPRRDVHPKAFAFDLQTTQRGKYELEILVDTGYGLETVALVPLFAGVKPDQRPVVSPNIGDPPNERLEDTLSRYLNEARKKVGLTPLKRDPRLDNIAMEHSRDMTANHFFGHVSPTQGSLKRRLEKRQLSPKGFAENIAKSNQLFRIHQNLMRSPSHRMGMLSPEFTHVGIGVVKRNGELVATEVYAAW